MPTILCCMVGQNAFERHSRCCCAVVAQSVAPQLVAASQQLSRHKAPPAWSGKKPLPSNPWIACSEFMAPLQGPQRSAARAGAEAGQHAAAAEPHGRACAQRARGRPHLHPSVRPLHPAPCPVLRPCVGDSGRMALPVSWACTAGCWSASRLDVTPEGPARMSLQALSAPVRAVQVVCIHGAGGPAETRQQGGSHWSCGAPMCWPTCPCTPGCCPCTSPWRGAGSPAAARKLLWTSGGWAPLCMHRPCRHSSAGRRCAGGQSSTNSGLVAAARWLCAQAPEQAERAAIAVVAGHETFLGRLVRRSREDSAHVICNRPWRPLLRGLSHCPGAGHLCGGARAVPADHGGGGRLRALPAAPWAAAQGPLRRSPALPGRAGAGLGVLRQRHLSRQLTPRGTPSCSALTSHRMADTHARAPWHVLDRCQWGGGWCACIKQRAALPKNFYVSMAFTRLTSELCSQISQAAPYISNANSAEHYAEPQPCRRGERCRGCLQGMPHLRMFSGDADGAAYKAREVLLASTGACSSSLLAQVRHCATSSAFPSGFVFSAW